MTVAVKVTGSPSFAGSSLDCTAVVVLTVELTTCVVASADDGVLASTLPTLSVATL